MKSQKHAVVLGAGMVGYAIAADLSKNYKVTSVDINFKTLLELKKKYAIKTVKADLTKPKRVQEVIKNADIVVNAVPGFIGFNTLKAVIEAGKNTADISFFAEDAFKLDKLARKNNVTAVTDCGVAPGMSNIIAGRYASEYKIQNFAFYVGGLPKKPTPPWNYQAPFSPADVIQEYLRPSRYVKNGKIVIKPALSDPELMVFPKAGTLEAFNTDGLRSLIKTLKIPNMIEKTLRYPGHIQLVQVLKDSGFFDKNNINFTSQILKKSWKYNKGDRDFTVMKVILKIKTKQRLREVIYSLYDEYDPKTGFSSMARTTGFTCNAVANLILGKKFTRSGINPAEFVGSDKDSFEFILDYLSKRHVNWKCRVN